MKKTLVAILALVLTLSLCSLAWAENCDKGDSCTEHLAKIGNEHYATLQAAFDAAKDGDTITLLKSSSGNGVVAAEGKYPTGLTIDFAGHSYTVGGVLVGSSGTASNAFQLLKGNTITFKNGAIYGDAAVAGDTTTEWEGAPAIMIQNYSNLTLLNMVVSGGEETAYTLSNNNGNTVIENTTINPGKAKNTSFKPTAFDVCRFSTYPSVSVTVKGASKINGDVEVSGTVGQGQSRQLTVETGVFAGKFRVDSGVPANISISSGTFSSEVNPDFLADTVNYVVSGTNSFTYFTNLNDAVAAAGADDEVKNLKETSAHSGSTITLKDGETVITTLHTEAATVDLPTLTKSGYTFKGWKDEDGKVYNGKLTISEENDGELVVREAVTLTAVWSANSYYYYPSTSTTDSTTGKASPKTFDAGVALYAGMALASLTGLAYTGKKKF